MTPDALPDGKYVVREAWLKRPKRSPNYFLRHQIEQVQGFLVIAFLAGLCFALTRLLESVTDHAVGISFAIVVVLGILILYWVWSVRPRRIAKLRQAAMLAAAKARLHGVRFDDSSVSDFVPDGFIQLLGRSILVFDTRHHLVRNLMEETDGPAIDTDWLFGMASWMRFSVEDMPRRGLANWLRQRLGLKPRLETVLAIYKPEPPLARFALASGFEGEARRLADKANRALAVDYAEAST
jgi:hypothetical protein